jgi:hypothetical protein
MPDLLDGKDPNKFVIQIHVERTPQGDKMHIECPPDMFPDYLVGIFERATTFYLRKLQSMEVVNTMVEVQKNQNIIRGIKL